jgi:nicotinate-nucleotide pyrophosphorylase (carboxylating)
MIDPAISFEPTLEDGDTAAPGVTLARLSGPARGILTAERVALNFMGRLSGIATATQALCTAVQPHGSRIVCTRKTTPGLRCVEKYAVRCGGGANHRFGLDDAILIKDNHIAIAGGIGPALQRARAHAGHLVKIEIEVDTLSQLEEVMALGADAVLLDNMTPAQLTRAVAMVAGRAVTEASGGVTLANAPAIAASGVDLISAGWLTHSAAVLDIGLDV